MADLAAAIGVHLLLTYGGLAIGLAVGVPLGLGALVDRVLARLVFAFTGVAQVVPALALAALAVPVLGIGLVPSLAVVAVGTLLPIARNTYIGLASPPAAELEAARGIGLSWWETVRHLRAPSGTPAFFAGLRFAAIVANSVAVVTVFIGSGGLGAVMLEGLSRFYLAQVLAGTLPAVAVGLLNDRALAHLEDRFVPAAFRAG